MAPKSLKTIFDQNDCDKSSKHGYHTIYQNYMKPRRDDPINILEIGIFEGKSVKSWLEYFPNAKIYCVDVFTRVSPDQIEVLNDDRVVWAKCDSTLQSEVSKLWKGVKFDFIIDDGLHTPAANRLTFSNFIGSLNFGGKYFIEDVFPIDKMSDSEMNIPWLYTRKKDYNKSEYAAMMQLLNMYNFTEHDNRAKAGNPDSYMIVVEK